MTEYLEFIIIIFSISNIIFKFEVVGYTPYIQIFGMVMGFIYCISPVQFLIEKIYNFEETDEKMPYSEALNRFSTDYNYENPIKQSY